MKILTSTKQIRDTIRHLLADESDNRIVAVAFVGADVLEFLPAPAGEQVYCCRNPAEQTQRLLIC